MTTTQFLPFCANIPNRLNNLKWLQASLNKLIVIGLLYSLLGIGTALAMSPAPSPGIPKFDPIPGTPNLSIDLHQTDIALRWNATEYAQFYTVHVYSGGQWQEVEDLYSTEATYDYERSGWDLSALQFKITACKTKPSWVFWGKDDRCSNHSNIVRLPQVNPAFSLSAYAVSLSTLSASPAGSVDSQILPADTVNAGRTIMATLRLRDAISWATQDIPWPIQIDKENFTVTSGKTILVKPGNYHIELLATQGNVRYVARALNVALNGAQSSIPLQLKTVLGDGALTMDTLNDLSAFNFQPSSAQLTALSQPKIGVKIDDSPETLLTFNPQLGITPQYHLISSGSHQIQLKVHDASLLKGRSQPQQENRWIVAGQDLTMDLIALVGGITTTLADADGTATLNFLIPSMVVDEVGGDPNNLQVILSLSGINNQPEDVLVDNLIYNATADAYQVQHTYSGLQADTQVAVSLTFSDISGTVNQLLGRCVANNLILDSVTRNIPCQLSLHRRITGGSHLLAELMINVLDTGNTPVSGASIYAKRRGAQANPGEEELGTLLGVTGSGALGTAGYLKTYLVPGSYKLTAKYRPTYSTAQEVINLEAFEVKNQNFILSRAPSISITAPAEGATADSSYTISWTASDPDNQAAISLYYDTNNSGYDGTLITDSLVEGIHNSYTWNTSSLSSGNYHIYAKIDDGVNTPVYDYGTGTITVNRLPSINITAPAEGATVYNSYSIQWIASDPDHQASISLYYDTNNSGYDGTLITDRLVEGTDTSHTWNTAAIPEGDYYLYAVINDGINEAKAYSAHPLTIDHDHGLVVDCNSRYYNYLGGYNALHYCNPLAMALLNPTNGSIHAWGYPDYGGSGAPTDNGYISIYSNVFAFAALKPDGSITSWGGQYCHHIRWCPPAPTDSGYTKIYSNYYAFAALKADGSISAWGPADYGGQHAPTDSGYIAIYSTRHSFTAIKADGSIKTWGYWDGHGYPVYAPTDSGYTSVYYNRGAFAALKADGSISAWGNAVYGGTGAPTDNGYTRVYSSAEAFAALKADGSIRSWGDSSYGGTGAPTDSGYTKIYSNYYAFAALKADGSISAWGNADYGGTGAPTDSGYTKIYSNYNAFAALKADGSISAWGHADRGGTGAPTDSGYISIYTNGTALVALRADGSITAWGHADRGGTGAPTDSGYISIYSTGGAFTAIKADGTVFTWGNEEFGGSGAPANLNDNPSQHLSQNYVLKRNDAGITLDSDDPSGISTDCIKAPLTDNCKYLPGQFWSRN